MITLLAAASAAAPPTDSCRLAAPGDDLRVHLVTLAPGDDLFSSMGHTVLVFSGGELDQPRAYNWGVFDTSQPDLLGRFLSGELQYFLTAMYLDPFLEFYASRTMVGQQLRLDADRAQTLYESVDAVAASKRDRMYTYHWATANCATKARDALDEALDGALRRHLDRPVDTTARFEAMRHFAPWPILGFAWDFVVSGRLDVPLSAWERAMVPEHLMHDVATLRLDDGPAVVHRCAWHPDASPFAPARPRSPLPFAVPGAVAVGLVGAAAARGWRRWLGAVGILSGAILGTLGVSSLMLWNASGIEGVGPTINWLLAGPQAWLLAWAGLKVWRGQPLSTAARRAVAAVGLVGLGAVLGPVIPGVAQANGPVVLALLPPLLASAAGLWWASRPVGNAGPSRP